VSTPAEDKDLEEYLRRKSAISLGYKKIYVEAPPPELDRAITARARRALRWIVPAIISAAIAVGVIVALNVGVNRVMQASVIAERNAVKLREERKAQQEIERLKQPIGVMVDANDIAPEEAKAAQAAQKKRERAARDQWLAEIEALQRKGKNSKAAAELHRMNAAYPEYVGQGKASESK
jgi:hypothetical protein